MEHHHYPGASAIDRDPLPIDDVPTQIELYPHTSGVTDEDLDGLPTALLQWWWR